MFTAILWDYDGTLANTPVKNIAVTRAVLGRLDPALLDPAPEALPPWPPIRPPTTAGATGGSCTSTPSASRRTGWTRRGPCGAPASWRTGPCRPLFGGLLGVLPRLAALAPMGICSQNDSGNIRAALAAHGAADCFAAVVGHADVDFARQKPDPAAFLACLDRLGLPGGRFAYIGDHAGDIAFGRNAQAAPAGHGPGGGGGLRGRRLGRRPVRGFGGGGRRGRPPRGPAGSAGRPVTQQRPRRKLPGGAAVCLPEVSACALFSGVL